MPSSVWVDFPLPPLSLSTTKFGKRLSTSPPENFRLYTVVQDVNSVFVHDLEISEQNRPKMCTFKPYIDECGNRGWKWNCRNRNIHVLTAAFVKKYRVHVDYVILRLRSRWKGVSHVVNNKTFPFDAFVSYAEEDYKLACITLYRELIRLGFQISLPDKDFIPGLSKAEQLLQCIDDSRKVIIVVTKKFLESGWDSYAVQMVVTHAFHNHRQKSIIVIIKDGIPVERMPKDLRYIWWSIISIQWPESEENMMTFWEELSNALRSD
ncbi:toll-like receptor 4 [Saccostrea echinata]|uniref:toll-like receptor 4 n=1 Tax=Saccostrea echinata TaxID=191078 RepID=UPI002A80452A|nr:toll-like receptor 4 [Saccostrea echinata]